MLQDLGSDHLPILITIPLSPVFCPNERTLPSTFRKLAEMTLPITLTLTVLLQRNILVSFSFFCCCSLYFPGTECGQIFHSFRPHQTQSLSLVGPLKRKKRLVKDVRLSLQLTEVMKIARLTSPLLDVLSLRHGSRLAFLSRPNLTLNLCTHSFVLSLALLPRLPPLLTSPTVLLPGNRLRSSPIT